VTEPPDTITWRWTRGVRIPTSAAAVIIVVLMALLMSNGGTSNIAGGGTVILVSMITLYRMQRISLTLGPTSVRAQNLLTSFEVQLSEILRLDPTSDGLTFIYERDGRRHVRTASAGQGIIDPWMFQRRARRGREIAATITARLSSHAAGQNDGSPSSP
jgi:hypothetical protein